VKHQNYAAEATKNGGKIATRIQGGTPKEDTPSLQRRWNNKCDQRGGQKGVRKMPGGAGRVMEKREKDA